MKSKVSKSVLGLGVGLGLIVGLLDHWIVGLLDCWIVGLLDCWMVGLMDCWIVGLLDCWMVHKNVTLIAKTKDWGLSARKIESHEHEWWHEGWHKG